VSLSPQSWFPIRAFVNDRAAATPIPLAEDPANLPPTDSVLCSGGFNHENGARPGGGGVIQPWGLFPASDLHALVLLAASRSPSGFGVRSLMWLELAALWDVPILVSDSLLDESDVLMFWGFCAGKGSICGHGCSFDYIALFFWGMIWPSQAPNPRPTGIWV
jgi:hypothetical protein